MTVANQITLVRIGLIPVFVLLAVYYSESVAAGQPEAWLRIAAIAVFIAAAASDGLDGWVARRFNQRSALGVVLDPLADKGLLLAGIITLSVSPWQHPIPLWFTVLVISRDAVILCGCALLKLFTDRIEVRPSRTGKAATALQMAAVAWILLELPQPQWIIAAAALLTLASGAGYVVRGLSALQAQGQPEGMA